MFGDGLAIGGEKYLEDIPHLVQFIAEQCRREGAKDNDQGPGKAKIQANIAIDRKAKKKEDDTEEKSNEIFVFHEEILAVILYFRLLPVVVREVV